MDAAGDSYDLFDHSYHHQLRCLQIELVKFQRQLIRHGNRVLVLIEGRDTAGKDGVIKHIVEHLSPRDTRVVALPAPTPQQQTEWYFQRYVAHLPAAGEFVLFNRSWYNRAGVERVMEFCSEKDADTFLEDAPIFEQMLVNSGIRLFKYYLDIDRHEQAKRLKERRRDPLSQWKTSSIDKVALKLWAAYTRARDEMLRTTHSDHAPWNIVRANDKHAARLNLIRHVLAQLHYRNKKHSLLRYDPRVVFTFSEARLLDHSLAS